MVRKSGILEFPLENWRLTKLLQQRYLVGGSPANVKYLGNYGALFDTEEEQNTRVITWKAIAWVLEDYGQIRNEITPPSLTYAVRSRMWALEPPPTVLQDIRWCKCERREKWDPEATLNSVEYNWPLIPRRFITQEDCAHSYDKFSKDHKTYVDPVCFQATIFSAPIAKWCLKF